MRRVLGERSGGIANPLEYSCFDRNAPYGTGGLRGRTGAEEEGGYSGVLKHVAHAYLRPELLMDGRCGGRKVVAFAITLTKDGAHLDGAAVLATSIGKKRICAVQTTLPHLQQTVQQ